MKNKLGTRQLPTAELLLDGTEARLVGEQGRGVANISSMLTISRLHTTLMAVSAMRWAEEIIIRNHGIAKSSKVHTTIQEIIYVYINTDFHYQERS